MFDDGTERQGREEDQAADDHDDADQQTDEKAAIGRESAGRGGTIFLPASDPAMASIGTIIRNRPMHIARPSVVL